jgi:F-type H+-transporting ATPase subunit b
MDLLSAEPGLIIWTVITFLLLLLILWKFAWNPILGALDARERAIQKTIEDAERLQSEAQALLEEHGKRLAEAREERNKILDQARQAGEHLKTEVLEKARREADQVLVRAKRQIELETEQAILTIRDQAAELAIKAAERVIERSLTDEDHRRMAREAVAELTEARG